MRRFLVLGSSLLAALAASLCCILPIVAAATGLATFGVAASFERFRPYFLALTAVLFVIGAALAYRDARRGCAPGSACAAKPLRGWNLAVLAVLGGLVVAFAFFPRYSQSIAEAVLPGTTHKQITGGPISTIFLIPDMDCPACAVTLRTAFEKLPGVSRASVDYNARRATITYDPARLHPEHLAEVVSQAGFHVKPLS